MLLAICLTGQLICCTADALRGDPYSVWAQGRTGALLLVACIYGAALVLLLPAMRARQRVFTWLAVGGALLFSVRFHAVRAWVRNDAREEAVWNSPPSKQTSDLVALLREVSAAQEQYRLGNHTYAGSVDSLSRWLPPRSDSITVQMIRRGDSGWSARASVSDTHCSIWVRDSTLRVEPWETEGAPACGNVVRTKRRQVHTVMAAPAREVAFAPQDVRGVWLQHRVDSDRSATAAASSRLSGGPYRWTTRIGGEMLASVAVVGNQVFAGAHGNGEFAVLSLDSGRVAFRIRAPNWIHHEPVVTSDLAIVTFGNNEKNPADQPVGSDPSGIAAYDRRTGVERWRRYSPASMMTSPVLYDSIVAAVSTSREAVGLRATDGKQLWRAELPSVSPMGNPLLIDTLMVVGLERARLCVLDVRTGARLYCRTIDSRGWGAGHASVASTGTTLLFTFAPGVGPLDALRLGNWRPAIGHVLRLPSPNFEVEEQVLLGLDLATGQERWRVRLGIGKYASSGHIAGTPTVADGIAYVPSPLSGKVFAVRPDSGTVLWSADVSTVRGSLLVTHGAVLAATRDTALVVLDATSGAVRCRQRLPGLSDRAGPTLAGETAIMTFRNGVIAARPIADWLSCRV